MKTFNDCLTHLLCLCLLTWSIGSSWEARAAGDPAPTPTATPSLEHAEFEDCETIRRNEGDSAYNACMRRNEDLARRSGQGVRVTPAAETTSTDDINSETTHSQVASLLLAILAAVTGIWYGVSCPTIPSAWIFAAASLAWVVGEVVMWAKVEKASEVELSALTNTTQALKDTQTDALIAAKKQTQKAADWAHDRSTLMMWVMIGYFAAGVVGIIEAILCYLTYTKDAAKPLFMECKGPDVAFNNNKDQFNQLEQMLRGKNLLTSGEKEGAEQLLEKIKTSLTSFLIQDAKAGHTQQIFVDLIMALVLVVVLIVVIKGLKASAKKQVIVRAVIYFVMGALVAWAKSINDDKAEKLDARVQAYQELIDAIQLQQKPSGPPPVGSAKISSTGDGVTAPPSTSDPMLNTNGDGKICLQGNPAVRGDATTGPCPCSSPKGCTSMDLSSMPPESGLKGQFPDFLSGITETFAKGANELASGKSKEASTTFNSKLGGKTLAKINSAKKELTRKLDEVLKKRFKDAEPFAELEKQMKKELSDSVKKAIAGVSPADMAKAQELLGGPSEESDQVNQKMKDLGFDKFVKVDESSSDEPETLGKLIGSGIPESTIKDTKEKFNIGNSFIDDIDPAEQEVSPDSKISIFEQISSRYRLSAWRIFFEDVEKTPSPTKTKTGKKASPPLHP